MISYTQTNQPPPAPIVNLATASPQTKASVILTPTIVTPTDTPTLLPTFTPTLSPTVNPTPTPSPTIYFSIGETRPISLPTPIVLPTATATPTPTFEPLHGQAIGGYIFEMAERVPNAPNGFFALYEWLPDKPNQLLTVRNSQMSEQVISTRIQGGN